MITLVQRVHEGRTTTMGDGLIPAEPPFTGLTPAPLVDMVVITGQRNFVDDGLIWAALDKLNPMTVVEGEAPGADRTAGRWAVSRNRAVIRVPAPWDEIGHAAGPVRNRWMLNIGQREADAGLSVCVLAFMDETKYGPSKGTRNCLTQAIYDFDLPIVDGVSLVLDHEAYERWLAS